MQGAVAAMLDDRRLHLQHGPIDLIAAAWGPDRMRALEQAARRFDGLLQDLVDELPLLRRPVGGAHPEGAVAQAMVRAVQPLSERFVTPMAAVAGAVADAVLAAMVQGCRLERAYVNDGGDIAVFLAPGQSLTAALFAEGANEASRDRGRVRLSADRPGRGIATSGWRGRSHSLGIADAVTVVARTAAAADAAATLIANAVDLPGHPAVRREPACDLAPDSDLGDRAVTVDVGPLTEAEAARALDSGCRYAEGLARRGLILGAALLLQGQVRLVGEMPGVSELRHADPGPRVARLLP